MNSFWLQLLPIACAETLYMVSASTIISLLLGLPLGFILFEAEKKKKSLFLYRALSFCINTTRSFPFAILMIACIPLTKWIVGTSLGTTAAIVPLSLSAAPFFARLAENAFKAVNPALQEAVSLMGASRLLLFYKILLPESLPAQIRALTLTAVNLIGYSSMAGLIGGGGLGQVALQYGYQRFNTDILFAAIACLLALVTIIQSLGNAAANHLLVKRGLSR
jgi:D-methionine transport system permease protein